LLVDLHPETLEYLLSAILERPTGTLQHCIQQQQQQQPQPYNNLQQQQPTTNMSKRNDSRPRRRGGKARANDKEKPSTPKERPWNEDDYLEGDDGDTLGYRLAISESKQMYQQQLRNQRRQQQQQQQKQHSTSTTTANGHDNDHTTECLTTSNAAGGSSKRKKASTTVSLTHLLNFSYERPVETPLVPVSERRRFRVFHKERFLHASYGRTNRTFSAHTHTHTHIREGLTSSSLSSLLAGIAS
jgi:hypothetical protein